MPIKDCAIILTLKIEYIFLNRFMSDQLLTSMGLRLSKKSLKGLQSLVGVNSVTSGSAFISVLPFSNGVRSLGVSSEKIILQLI